MTVTVNLYAYDTLRSAVNMFTRLQRAGTSDPTDLLISPSYVFATTLARAPTNLHAFQLLRFALCQQWAGGPGTSVIRNEIQLISPSHMLRDSQRDSRWRKDYLATTKIPRSWIRSVTSEKLRDECTHTQSYVEQCRAHVRFEASWIVQNSRVDQALLRHSTVNTIADIVIDITI